MAKKRWGRPLPKEDVGTEPEARQVGMSAPDADPEGGAVQQPSSDEQPDKTTHRERLGRESEENRHPPEY